MCPSKCPSSVSWHRYHSRTSAKSCSTAHPPSAPDVRTVSSSRTCRGSCKNPPSR
ncbi:hypothetical protein C8R44DRAFT_771920 [Mycena epipterygia]|nr:hypothetical protein C8R44DRAFT_771920 [Mycena epipterygia]